MRGRKRLWIIIVLLLPFAGPIMWYALGRGRRRCDLCRMGTAHPTFFIRNTRTTVLVFPTQVTLANPAPLVVANLGLSRTVDRHRDVLHRWDRSLLNSGMLHVEIFVIRNGRSPSRFTSRSIAGTSTSTPAALGLPALRVTCTSLVMAVAVGIVATCRRFACFAYGRQRGIVQAVDWRRIRTFDSAGPSVTPMANTCQAWKRAGDRERHLLQRRAARPSGLLSSFEQLLRHRRAPPPKRFWRMTLSTYANRSC